jgi:hypothetical protein
MSCLIVWRGHAWKRGHGSSAGQGHLWAPHRKDFGPMVHVSSTRPAGALTDIGVRSDEAQWVLSGQNRGPEVRFGAAGCCRQTCLPRYLCGADARCRSVVRNTVRFFSLLRGLFMGGCRRAGDWLGGAWGFAGVRLQESHGVACSWGFVVEH